MPNEHRDDETPRIVRDLSDAEKLARRGVDGEWIRSCADLVTEFQRLQEQFRVLESELSRTEPESGQDTLLL